ncbi:MAG: 6-phosphogluconolactonase, partial [Promethearchaeota archaeon]
SGIPFEGSDVLIVKLDENTVENAVQDGHFSSKEESPLYAISMGAELVYKAKNVILLANGERKVESVSRSLLDDPTPDMPISYGQIYSNRGGNLVYVVGKELLQNKDILRKKGIEIREL